MNYKGYIYGNYRKDYRCTGEEDWCGKSIGQYMGSPSAYVPMPQAEERETLTQAEIDERAAMRKMLQESGTIDRMEEMEKEKADLEKYINLFGYNPKYGIEGKAIGSVTYKPQPYNPRVPLYEA